MNRRSTFGLSISRFRTYLRVELLEGRDVPSSTVSPLHSADVQATVMEGEDTWFSLTNSGNSRVDANTTESPYAGVGSILVTTNKSSFIGTAAAIGPRQVLTAAHVVDLNNDGKVNQRDNATGTYFILNFGEDQSQRIAVEKFDLHPNFTGFNHPAVNDDIAVLTLAEDLPEGVPIYPIADFDLVAGSTVTMVGYGRSGDGVKGYDTSASLTVKRVGANVVDAFYIQDDKNRPDVNEVFRFDFDSAYGTGPLGGPGIYLETQLGQGDSGGPSFISTGNGLTIVGVNTFIQGAKAPKFGSMGGGMNVFAYRDFINSIIHPDSPTDGSSVGPRMETAPGSTPAPLVPLPGAYLGTKPQKGIRVGAKAVSAEFAISRWTSADTTVEGANLQGVDVSLSSRSTDTTVETFSEKPFTQLRSIGSVSLDLDPLLARIGISEGNLAVSLDSGLMALVGAEVLSVE